MQVSMHESITRTSKSMRGKLLYISEKLLYISVKLCILLHCLLKFQHQLQFMTHPPRGVEKKAEKIYSSFQTTTLLHTLLLPPP
jgi:hypothetical protein